MKNIVDKYWTLYESRISAGATAKLPDDRHHAIATTSIFLNKHTWASHPDSRIA